MGLLRDNLETKGMTPRGSREKECVKKVKGDMVNNIVLHLHTDRWLPELVG